MNGRPVSLCGSVGLLDLNAVLRDVLEHLGLDMLDLDRQNVR